MKHLQQPQKLQTLLRNNKGETLIEVLASIVVATLSVALLFGCIITASDMDKKAKAVDKQHYVDLTAADAQAELVDEDGNTITPPTGKVTITRTDPAPQSTATPGITIYGDEGMYSYSYSSTTTTGEGGS